MYDVPYEKVHGSTISYIILLMQKNVDRDGWMTTNTAREKFKRVFLCV